MLNERRNLSTLKEHPFRKDFYQIPRYPLLYINEDQTILDSRKDIALMPYIGYYDYLKVDVEGLAGGVLVHRAVAETFLDSGNVDPKKYQVNHKDGNKLNNHPSNLEFVTRFQNNVHAFKVGLRTDNRAVLCKDLRTGEIQRFYSMNECSRIIATNQGYLSHYLKGVRSKPVMGVYEVIFEGEEWKGFDDSLIKEHPENELRDVVSYSSVKNEYRIFRGVSHASTELGIKPTLIKKSIEEGKVAEGYLFMTLQDFKKKYVGNEKVTRVSYSGRRGRRPPTPIIVEDLATGEVSRWISTERFARLHGVDKKTIQKSMSVKDGRWCNFKITYVRNGVEPASDRREETE